MNTVADKKINKDKTNLFMEKLKQRFQTDKMGLTPVPDLGSRDISKDLVMSTPSQKTREYAYFFWYTFYYNTSFFRRLVC